LVWSVVPLFEPRRGEILMERTSFEARPRAGRHFESELRQDSERYESHVASPEVSGRHFGACPTLMTASNGAPEPSGIAIGAMDPGVLKSTADLIGLPEASRRRRARFTSRKPTSSSHVRVASVAQVLSQMSGLGTFRFESPCYSGRSESARRGTTNDRRKIGKNLFPVHRKRDDLALAASKVRVRLKFRPLRACRCDVQLRLVSRSCRSFRPTDTLTVDHDIVRATTDLHSDPLCVELEELPTSSVSFPGSGDRPVRSFCFIVYLPSLGPCLGVAQFAGWVGRSCGMNPSSTAAFGDHA